MTGRGSLDSLDDLLGQPGAVATLRAVVNSLNNGGVPNGALFLVGPAGTGKTSTPYLLEREIPGTRVDEVNCAGLNGRALSERLEQYANFAGVDWSDDWETKIILLLDEIDKLGPKERVMLRRPLELLSSRALVVLTANKPLGDAGLESRCLRVDYVLLDAASARKLARKNAAALGLTLSDWSVEWIVQKAKGDARQLGALVPIAPAHPAVPVVASNLSAPVHIGSKGGRPRSRLDNEMVQVLRAQGYSWAEIARQTGSSATTVRRRLTETSPDGVSVGCFGKDGDAGSDADAPTDTPKGGSS